MKKVIEKIQINLQPSHVKVFEFVKQYVADHLYSPEFSEISAGVKLTDRQIYRLVNDLISLGALSQMKHKRRGLSIVSDLDKVFAAKK